jgi:hypothetical protein
MLGEAGRNGREAGNYMKRVRSQSGKEQASCGTYEEVKMQSNGANNTRAFYWT